MGLLYAFGVALMMTALSMKFSEAKPSSCLYEHHIQEMPADCANMTYCMTKHKDYPQNLVDCLLKKFKIYKASKHQEIKKLSGRVGNATDMLDCAVEENKDPIYEIIDEDNNTRVVVQSPGNFMQTIDIERCSHPGLIKTDTSHLTSDLLTTHNFSCENIILQHQFLVVSTDGQKLEFVNVKDGIPVACVCRYNDEISM